MCNDHNITMNSLPQQRPKSETDTLFKNVASRPQRSEPIATRSRTGTPRTKHSKYSEDTFIVGSFRKIGAKNGKTNKTPPTLGVDNTCKSSLLKEKQQNISPKINRVNATLVTSIQLGDLNTTNPCPGQKTKESCINSYESKPRSPDLKIMPTEFALQLSAIKQHALESRKNLSDKTSLYNTIITDIDHMTNAEEENVPAVEYESQSMDHDLISEKWANVLNDGDDHVGLVNTAVEQSSTKEHRIFRVDATQVKNETVKDLVPMSQNEHPPRELYVTIEIPNSLVDLTDDKNSESNCDHKDDDDELEQNDTFSEVQSNISVTNGENISSPSIMKAVKEAIIAIQQQESEQSGVNGEQQGMYIIRQISTDQISEEDGSNLMTQINKLHTQIEGEKIYTPHVSVMKDVKELVIERCRQPGCGCQRLHCPLCTETIFKPVEFICNIKRHFLVHLKHSIKFNDFTCCMCRQGCQKESHYHCPMCDTVCIKKLKMVEHLQISHSSQKWFLKASKIPRAPPKRKKREALSTVTAILSPDLLNGLDGTNKDEELEKLLKPSGVIMKENYLIQGNWKEIQRANRILKDRMKGSKDMVHIIKQENKLPLTREKLSVFNDKIKHSHSGSDDNFVSLGHVSDQLETKNEVSSVSDDDTNDSISIHESADVLNEQDKVHDSDSIIQDVECADATQNDSGNHDDESTSAKMCDDDSITETLPVPKENDLHKAGHSYCRYISKNKSGSGMCTEILADVVPTESMDKDVLSVSTVSKSIAGTAQVPVRFSSVKRRSRAEIRALGNVFTCPVCKVAKYSKDSYYRHIQRYHKQKVHMCEKCNKSYAQNSDFLRHSATCKGPKTARKFGQNNVSNEPFPCEICNALFSTKDTLKAHFKYLHTTEGECSCKVCGKSFRAPRYLKSHMLRHSNARPFVCNICNRSFKERGTLKEHMNTHKDQSERVKKYKCNLCPKSYFRLAALNDHMNWHTGEKPFTCDICGKQFTGRCAMNKHRMGHSADKPYTCSKCGKAFKFRHKLLSHFVTHTGRSPHVCSSCGKVFTTSTTLRKHTCRGSGVMLPGKDIICDSNVNSSKEDVPGQLYMCSICNLTFTSWDTVTQHMLLHTESEPVLDNISSPTPHTDAKRHSQDLFELADAAVASANLLHTKADDGIREYNDAELTVSGGTHVQSDVNQLKEESDNYNLRQQVTMIVNDIERIGNFSPKQDLHRRGATPLENTQITIEGLDLLQIEDGQLNAEQAYAIQLAIEQVELESIKNSHKTVQVSL